MAQAEGREKKRKRKTTIMIDEDLYWEIARIAPQRFGKIGRSISNIISEALREYIRKLKEESEETP